MSFVSQKKKSSLKSKWIHVRVLTKVVAVRVRASVVMGLAKEASCATFFEGEKGVFGLVWFCSVSWIGHSS
jgi:hypothetical protein